MRMLRLECRDRGETKQVKVFFDFEIRLLKRTKIIQNVITQGENNFQKKAPLVIKKICHNFFNGQWKSIPKHGDPEIEASNNIRCLRIRSIYIYIYILQCY